MQVVEGCVQKSHSQSRRADLELEDLKEIRTMGKMPEEEEKGFEISLNCNSSKNKESSALGLFLINL